jgi:N utilization substance protein B
MQALYAYQLSEDDPKHIIENVLIDGLEEPILSFAKDLFLKAILQEKESSEIIQVHTLNWEISRIALIDRLLLRLAVTEFLYFPDIPPKVTINECIEVAKVYSTAQSGKFINGILDAILLDLISAGKIQKKGRGLIDSSIRPTSR